MKSVEVIQEVKILTTAGYGPGTPSPVPVPLRLERIATQAQQYPDMAFTTLAHHLDVAMLERACGSLNLGIVPGMAPGNVEQLG